LAGAHLTDLVKARLAAVTCPCSSAARGSLRGEASRDHWEHVARRWWWDGAKRSENLGRADRGGHGDAEVIFGDRSSAHRRKIRIFSGGDGGNRTRVLAEMVAEDSNPANVAYTKAE